MKKETISAKMAICLLALAVFGTNSIMGITTVAKQDSWITFLIALVIVLPLVLIYARISKLFPEKNFDEICDTLFGKVLSKVFQFIMLWYSMHLAALIIRNFTEYLGLSTLLQTPNLLIMIFITMACVYLAKSGVTVLGRWAVICLFLIILLVLFTLILSIENIELDNLKPFFSHSVKEMADATFQIFGFPLAETVLYLMIIGNLKKGESTYKVWVCGLLLGALLIFVFLMKNRLVLGIYLDKVYYSSFVEARVIKLSSYFTRIEGVITFSFIFAGITKATICLIAASKLFCSIIGEKQPNRIILPLSLIAMVISGLIYKNTSQMLEFIKVYKFYAS